MQASSDVMSLHRLQFWRNTDSSLEGAQKNEIAGQSASQDVNASTQEKFPSQIKERLKRHWHVASRRQCSGIDSHKAGVHIGAAADLLRSRHTTGQAK
jgi:hypothetical protein